MVNYLGPEDGEGMRIYYDGTQAGSDAYKASTSVQLGNGRVVIGRRHVDGDYDYAGVDVDELLFFNEKLTDQQIMDIKNMV